MSDEQLKNFPEGSLIKTVDEPNKNLSPSEKVQLNRRGNTLFNTGELETARRIFQTTGYSDGLNRIGETYLSQRKPVDALKMFKLAHDEGRSNELIAKAAQAIRKMLEDKEK